MRPGDFSARLRVGHHEIAEAEMLADVLLKFVCQSLRGLLKEAHSERLCDFAYALLRRLHQERHLGVIFPDMLAKVHAGIQFLILRQIAFMQHETNIGDNSQQVVLVFFIKGNGIVVVGCHQDLRAGALTRLLLLLVERVAHSRSVLVQDDAVQRRQIG